MKAERFDPETDGVSVRACHEIYLSGLPDDDPFGPPMSPRAFAGWLALGWTEDPLETWLARDDSGEPCGWYLLNLPQRENRHRPPWSSWCTLPGAGQAGVRRCSATRPGRARPGRPNCARDATRGKARLARRSRARSRPGRLGTGVRRVLPSTARPRIGGPRAGGSRGRRPGYTLRDLAVGPAPEDAVAGVAAVNGALADAPRATRGGRAGLGCGPGPAGRTPGRGHGTAGPRRCGARPGHAATWPR